MKLMQGGKEITAIDFGEVEIGVKKDIDVIIVNDSGATLKELRYILMRTEVKILDAPAMIAPHAEGVIRLSWTPKLKLKAPKVDLEITGKEVYE